MKLLAEQLRLSASDLANHLCCRHLTALDLAAANGQLDPPTWQDPALAVLQERGLEHERAYLDHLRKLGLSIVKIAAEDSIDSAFQQTSVAMRFGWDVIVQATLTSGRWLGRADILRRVDRRSDLGDWSYEVIDTKLARETRAGTILQLCLYSDIVAEVQGTFPEQMHVVSPGSQFVPESFRVQDFLAYYRFVRRRLKDFADKTDGASVARTYPDPVPHCDTCRWWSACNRKRHADDHLCLVAGISRLQRRELETWGVSTLQELATIPLPLPRRPNRGTTDGYARVWEQACVQLEGRQRNAPVHKLLPFEPGRGLARLPEPSPADIFFDVEGDPFVGEAGLEYLLGWVINDDLGEPRYRGLWAFDREEEQTALESFVDAVMQRWSSFPGLHVYHFTPYDPAALKRLMGRYASREDEIDRMLRAGLFVDLHAVLKQALRASVEQYSIKNLEAFYGFERKVALAEASSNRRVLEGALELGGAAAVPEGTRTVVEAYNRDDCVSVFWLRQWLEAVRAEVIARGVNIERPSPSSGEPSESLDERSRRVEELRSTLAGNLPTEAKDRTEGEQARWLLANMLEWHRREEKASWWEYFRLLSLTDEDLLEEKTALSRLEFVERIGGTPRCPVDRYRYARQDTDIREDDKVHTKDIDGLGTVQAINLVTQNIDIKKSRKAADIHPSAVFAHAVVRSKVLSDSLSRLGTWVAEHGIDANGSYQAARDLLLRRPPRTTKRPSSKIREDSEDTMEAARRLAISLDHGILPIQGPPGSGKTYTGARMICELVRAGKRVGVTAVSHKVIRNLLEEVVVAGREEGLPVRCVEKVGGESGHEEPAIQEVSQNEEVLTRLQNGDAQVAAGTAWLWARGEFFESVDVLFVDEAGQMSLANVLSVAQAARSLVLLGDPQQLEQPQKGCHPEGTGVSALEHVLAGQETLPDDRGLFLAETWRLHPAICGFTSEIFYESRLRARPGLDRQALEGSSPWTGAGLWFAPVDHEGNQSSCPEEVEEVAEILESLIGGKVAWIDAEGRKRPLSRDDILIVAPYNAQVAGLKLRLPGARVGTVDKFQGQEAPVVIYSMTTSSPEEAPRGMEFLYSLNRLNVATSRARCACILVASPRLFEPECRSPRQMQLANAFCRYLELARTVEDGTGT
jgi:uncharacterized protein